MPIPGFILGRRVAAALADEREARFVIDADVEAASRPAVPQPECDVMP